MAATLQREALVRLQALANDSQLALTDWRPLVVYGNPADCILEQEEEQGADLIVLGKHGAGKSTLTPR